MKYMKIQLLFCLFMLASASMDAAKIYILFDPSCMDQLEFKQSRPDGRSDYYAYHVNIRSGEKMVLEVGPQGSNIQNYLPSPNLSCQTGGFDKALMNRINRNIDEVYMVYPKSDRKFIISPISMASYYTKRGNIISYDSPKYRFRFDIEHGTIGENIAVDNPAAKVYFEGRVENNCTGAYLFRQLSPMSAYPLIDLVLIPEIGIAEERSGANAAAAQNNTIQLSRMNGKLSQKFLLEICGTEPGSQGSIVQNQARGANEYNTYASRGGYNPPSGNNLPPGAIVLTGGNNTAPITSRPTVRATRPNTFVPTINSTAPAATVQQTATNNPPTHTVKSGETLYGIAREHNVSVNQIKTWNSLKSNTIRRGQVLQIQETGPQVQQAQVVTQPAASLQSRGYAANTSLGGSPIPYQQSSGRISAPSASANTHIVQPGETLSSIALSYGYTAKKFRDINSLRPNDYVKVGQRLKVSDCNCPAAGSAERPIQPPAVTRPNVPSNFGSTGGRITPNTFNERTPAPTYSQPSISPTSISSTSGPAAYSAPSQNQARGGYDYNAIVPSAYDVVSSPAPSSSLSNLESRARATTTPNRYRSTGPESYSAPVKNYTRPTISPYPSPNTPISYDEVQGSSNSQKRVHIVADGESLYGIARRYGTTTERLRQINNLGPNDPIISYQTIYLD